MKLIEHFINGKKYSGDSKRYSTIFNPATGEESGKVNLGSTNDLNEAVKNAKAGQIELKNDKDGNIGLSFGKKSFSDDNLIKNFNTVIDTLEKEKSNLTIKGDLIRNNFVTSTM